MLTVLNVFQAHAQDTPQKPEADKSEVVTAVEISGNEVIKTERVRLAVSLKEGDILSKEAIQEDVNNIYLLGYFADVGAEVKDHEQGKKVIFKVVENNVIQKVKITGNSVIPEKELMEVMKSGEGQVFNIPILNSDVKRINELYSKRGYSFSGVTNMDVKEQGETIKIEITEGKLEEIRLEGKHKTKDYIIYKQLRMKKGEIFNSMKVMSALQKIFNLGFFETVKPRYDKGEKNPTDVILAIELKEQKTGTASLGGGYSSANGFVGFLEVTWNNFRGLAQKLKVKLEVGGITTYELSFYDPYFYHETAFGASVYKSKIERDYIRNGQVEGVYDESRTGGTVSLGKAITDKTRLSFKLRDEKIEIDPQAGMNAQLASDLKNSSDHIQVFSATVTKDTRNNYLTPTSGLMDSFTVATTGGVLKGKNTYTKYTGKLQRYFGTSKKTVLAFRCIAGFTDVSDGSLPVYEEFNVGGANTLRGYETYEFTGRRLFVLNSEYRYTFNKNFTGVFFVDAADAWGIAPEYRNVVNPSRDEFDVKYTAGVGIRFNSPVGPIRLDYGKPLDDSSRDGKSYFSMGSMF
jgi:outer membrane protein insertion porin family